MHAYALIPLPLPHQQLQQQQQKQSVHPLGRLCTYCSLTCYTMHTSIYMMALPFLLLLQSRLCCACHCSGCTPISTTVRAVTNANVSLAYDRAYAYTFSNTPRLHFRIVFVASHHLDLAVGFYAGIHRAAGISGSRRPNSPVLPCAYVCALSIYQTLQ